VKRLSLILSLIVAAGVVAWTPAMAGSWRDLTQKTVSVTVTVTPSPIVYVPRTVAQAVRHPAPHPEVFARLNPALLSAYHMVAVTQGTVPVTMNVQADPTSMYLHIISNNTILNAGYGANTYACAYSVYAFSPYLWRVMDWVYGSSTSGSLPFPTFNYSLKSDLAWLAETVTTTYAPFVNSGSPGEQVFTGAANTNRTICIDLQLTVPSNIPAGTYSATITYDLQFYY